MRRSDLLMDRFADLLITVMKYGAAESNHQLADNHSLLTMSETDLNLSPGEVALALLKPTPLQIRR
jgi:hypothetical protein